MDIQTKPLVHEIYWHKVIGNLIDMVDKPNFWNVLVRYLGDWIEFDCWVVLRFSSAGHPQVYAENGTEDGGVDQLFADYVRGFYRLDPFYIYCMDSPRTGLLRLDDVAPDNFQFEDYYQRYFRLNIVADEVQFNLPVEGGDVVILSLGSKKRYTPSDIQLLLTIESWVVALMRQRFAFDALHDQPLSVDQDESASASISDAKTPRSGAPEDLSLTSRELEIMQLLLSGFSSKGIAQKLKISPETVKAHRRHIYLKLGVKSHPELLTIYMARSMQP